MSELTVFSVITEVEDPDGGSHVEYVEYFVSATNADEAGQMLVDWAPSAGIVLNQVAPVQVAAIPLAVSAGVIMWQDVPPHATCNVTRPPMDASNN